MSEADDSSDPAVADPELSTNELFALLRHPRRRDVLRYLIEHQEEVPLEELSAGVASRETSPSDQRLARVSIDLHHVHLPKLADAGVVRYDPRSEVVEAREIPPDLAELLDRLAGEDG